MLKTTGKIFFQPPNITKKQHLQDDWKSVAIVLINDDTEAYYRWFLEKRFNLKLNKTLRGSHLTFINDRFDNKNLFNELKKKYDNVEVDITYNPKDLRYGNNCWFILCQSPVLMEIRNELNLGKPFFDFHITLGRAEHLQAEHSEYIKKTLKNFNQYYI